MARRLLQRRSVQAAATLIAGGVLLLALLVFVNPSQIGAALRQASPGWVGLAVALYLGFLLVRGWRWQIILRASAPQTGLGDPTAITVIGFGINAVSPFKVGDLVRAAAIGRRTHLGMGGGIATVGLERVLDVLALLAIALGTAALSGAQATGGQVWRSAAALSIVSALVMGIALWLVTHEAQALRWWSRLMDPLPVRLRAPARALAVSALQGLRSLRSPARLAVSAVLSVVIWTLVVLSLFAYFRALSPALPTSTLLLALTLFILTQAISVTPGSLGTYEAFFVVTLRAFGASPPATVLAVALLSHLASTAVVLVCAGLGALWLRLVRPAQPVPAESLPQS